MDRILDPNRPPEPPAGSGPDAVPERRSRLPALIEPVLVMALAFVASILLGAFGLLATATIVEGDPFDSLFGTERKLEVALTPKDGPGPPALELTRQAVARTFAPADAIVVPDGKDAWRLLAWIEGDVFGAQLDELAATLDELGWKGPAPQLRTQPRYTGVLENPRRMRAYVPTAMTLQALAFVLAAWLMVRWRKPQGFARVARPAETVLWSVGAAVVAFLVSTLVGGLLQAAGLEVEEQPWIQALMSDPAVLRVVLPWLVLVGPVSEEVFFRGYVFRRLWSSSGPRAAYALSALLFAVIHWHPVGLPMYAVIGLIFCWVYRRTGSLWAPVLAHAVYNGIVVALPWLVTPGG